MRNRFLIFTLFFLFGHLNAPGGVQAQETDSLFLSDEEALNAPLTEADRDFVDGAKDNPIEIETVRSDGAGITVRYSTSLFGGVKARFVAKDHCEKQGKALDEDNVVQSPVVDGEIVETFSCLSPGEAESIRQLRKAANSGDADAQYELGRKYRQGDGVDKNLRQAAEWFRLAANQGHSDAQNILGVMYSTEKAYEAAADMFRRAARQNHSAAQVSLGVAYELGLGVPVDYARAYLWYGLSRYDGVETLRERIRRKMTGDQISRSETMTRECIKTRMSSCD